MLSEGKIDTIVIAQADDDSAWEKPIRARKAKPAPLPLSSELAARAAFFARLHREINVEHWLKQVIQDRSDRPGEGGLCRTETRLGCEVQGLRGQSDRGGTGRSGDFMLMLPPDILEKNGKEPFAVSAYEEFVKVWEDLSDYEDLKALRQAKMEEANAPTISFHNVRKALEI